MLSKKFLKFFGTDSSASKYFTPEIWKQIKPLFSDCCGMGRKLVGLKDADGNKIEIKGFPFTFDSTSYATKESFEQAMADLYGAGYSTHLVDCCHLMFIWNRGLTEVPDYIEERKSINLSILKEVDNITPTIGTNVTFTLTASNIGIDSASSVVVTDVLPSGYAFVSATPSVGTWVYPNWSIGTLENGASETIAIVAEVLPSGIYDNTAIITGLGIDDNLTNNTTTLPINPTPAVFTFTAPDFSFYPYTIDEIELWSTTPIILITNNIIPAPFSVVSSPSDVVNIINTFIGSSFIPNTTIAGSNFVYTGTQAFQVIVKSTGTPVQTYTFS